MDRPKMFGEQFPKGALLPFLGKDIPVGWAVCDGKDGRPDMRAAAGQLGARISYILRVK